MPAINAKRGAKRKNNTTDDSSQSSVIVLSEHEVEEPRAKLRPRKKTNY